EKPYLGMTADDGLADLLATYGFAIEPGTVIDKRSVKGSVPPGSGVMNKWAMPLARSLQNGPHDLLAGIEFFPIPYASPVKLVGPLASGRLEGGEVIPLAMTSKASYLQKDMMVLTRQWKPK